MKKIAMLFALALGCAALSLPVTAHAAEKLPDFSDDFEGYEVTGDYIENDKTLTAKWDNNVFRGGAALGMDSHIYNIGKIEYESGTSGNRVLHLNNAATGANTFFYMGPANDYRVRNFTVQFRIKFLAEGVTGHSWAGISFRKKANAHYTGTNNLLFVAQRDVSEATVTGQSYAIFNGGSETNLDSVTELYGERLSISHAPYNVAGSTGGADLPWIDYKLVVSENNYKMYLDDVQVTDCTFNIPQYDYYGYLSLNCCTSNILVDDFSVTVSDETLPPVIEPLATPVVTLDEEQKLLKWEPVEGASLYLINFGDDSSKTVANTEYSLERLQPGTYRITVTALTDDSFENKDSAPSEPVTYTVAEEKEGGDGCGATVSLGAGAAVLALAGVLLVRRKRK